MQDNIKKHIAKCDSCQHSKKQWKCYRYLPMKEAEYKTWEKLCVDLIGEYRIKRKGKNKSLNLKVAMILLQDCLK